MRFAIECEIIRDLFLAFAACAVPRLAALAFWPADTGTLYFQFSTAVLDGHLPADFTTYVEPLYPAVLAALRAVTGSSVTGTLLLQIAIASFGGVFMFLLTSRAAGARAGRIATLLYAMSPYLVRQSVAFMEVTLAVVLLIAAAWRMQAPPTAAGAAGIGALLGVIVLTRFSFLPIAIGGAALLFARGGVLRGAAATAAAAAIVAPWMAYSRAAGGSALPSRIGENLLVSTSAWAETVVPRTNVDVLLPETDRAVRAELARRGITNPTRLERDRVMSEWAWRYVREHPLDTLRLKLRNLAYVLQPRLLPFTQRRGEAVLVDGRLQVPPQAPRPWPLETAAALFQTTLMAGTAIGAWIRRRRLLRDDGFLVVVAVSIVAMNVAFFPTSRLLAPMTFVLMFYAAGACARLSRSHSRYILTVLPADRSI